MLPVVPYCGTPPHPGELLARFNLDPVLIAALVGLTLAHLRHARAAHAAARERLVILAGWLTAALALVSPLCALSVALFAARIGQHMVLILIAAPLIALGLPPRRPKRRATLLGCAAGAFFLLLWFWHMPVPYAATFASTPVYWTMHVTLFGSALLLWREILYPSLEHGFEALALGALTSMQMGLLGALLTLAERPMFVPHFTTTQAWGFTPLEDQQLGGVLMWVPGIALFLWALLRSLERLWRRIETARPAR